MIKSINAVIFSVSNLNQACDFYENILGMTLSYKNDKSNWAEFNLNGVKFSLTRKQPCGNGTNPAVSLYVDSLERSVEEYKNKGVVFPGSGEIKTEFFGNFIEIQDPDGNVLILFERPA